MKSRLAHATLSTTARLLFQADRLTRYIGPDGSQLDSDFKLAYTNLFINQGYRIIYTGNGNSDFEPARRCHYIFATGALLSQCLKSSVACQSFTDLNEVVKVLESRE